MRTICLLTPYRLGAHRRMPLHHDRPEVLKRTVFEIGPEPTFAPDAADDRPQPLYDIRPRRSVTPGTDTMVGTRSFATPRMNGSDCAGSCHSASRLWVNAKRRKVKYKPSPKNGMLSSTLDPRVDIDRIRRRKCVGNI